MAAADRGGAGLVVVARPQLVPRRRRGGDLSFELPSSRRTSRAIPRRACVEAIANEVHVLRSLRTQVEMQSRQNPDNALGLAQAGGGNAQRLLAATRSRRRGIRRRSCRTSRSPTSSTAPESSERGGRALRAPRSATGRDGCNARLACTFLLEGDWYATPGSSPEALGFDLGDAELPSPFLDRRDVPRAAAAYDRADELLAGIDEPRAHARARAPARGARLAVGRPRSPPGGGRPGGGGVRGGGRRGRPACSPPLTRLLADIALGQIATTRRAAGTGFDLEPRGPVADARELGRAGRQRQLGDRDRPALPARGRALGPRSRLRAGGGHLRAGCPARPTHRSRDAGGGAARAREPREAQRLRRARAHALPLRDRGAAAGLGRREGSCSTGRAT